jgi:hypothetical protein
MEFVAAFKTLENGKVTVVAVFQTAVYTADCGGAEACLLGDVGIYVIVFQKLCGQKSLGHFLELGNCAKILKEAVTFI